MPAPAWEIIATPVWEGRTTHLTLLKRFHMAVHLHLDGDIHSPIRASALRKTDLVHPLVIQLPCCLVAIAAPETGVSTKTRVNDGSVLMDQRWLH